jgi:hypothetical protein
MPAWKPEFVRLRTAFFAWRARRVSDPVERLRLLRRTVGGELPGAPGAPRAARALAAGGALLLVLAPLGAVRQQPPGSPLAAGLVPRLPAAAGQPAPDVWLVEQQPGFELYSNGLRVEREYETAGEARSYEVYARGREELGPVEQRTAPAGIVYHSTESATAEFRADQASRLKLLGKYLLRYVRDERAYHYLIDRFGRVWRIVRESDAANHAGYSVWADDRWTYVNLNWSFLGVSVEGQSAAPTAGGELTHPQLLALRQLTEMLRSRHGIGAANCVTHAQVSVNPSNRQAGYHYDWATRFPFAALGLPDNYQIPVASLWLFGFSYDPSLVNLTGESYWKGLVLGEDFLRQSAGVRGLPVEQYRAQRIALYRRILARLKERAALAREPAGGQSE